MLDPLDPPARPTPGTGPSRPDEARRGGVTRRWLVAYRELVALRGSERGAATAANATPGGAKSPRGAAASDAAAGGRRLPGRRSPG